MKGDAMKRADPMILNSEPCVGDVSITWMCVHGYHGNTERRSVSGVGWENMYEGFCAGTIYGAVTGNESPCTCDCHNA